MYEKNCSKVKLRKRWQNQDWSQEKWCCLCDGIGKKSFCTSCCRPVKRLILIFTVNNWKDYAKQSRESDQNWSTGKPSSSIMTMLDSTHLWRPVKNWENLVGKFWCNNFIVLTLHQIIICFDLYFLNDVKLISKEACENHLSQFFPRKSQWFYRIMVLSQKWHR